MPNPFFNAYVKWNQSKFIQIKNKSKNKIKVFCMYFREMKSCY